MKEKIKSEIQRLIKAYSPIQSAEGKYKVEAYEDLLTFINSLEEPANEDLEEFAKRESELFGEREYEVDYIDRNALTKGFYWGCKTGAQWQKEQDQSTIELAEDHAMLAGMEKMKEEMIDKVCKWLAKHWREYVWLTDNDIIHFGHWEHDFKRAMEK